MIKSFIITLFFLLFLPLSAQKITWSKTNRLSWNDFQAPKDFKKPTDSSVAFTNCGVSYLVTKSTNPKAKVEIHVKAVFDQSKSWKKSDSPGNSVLVHEQLHFDIAEVYARKIRKMIEQKIVTTADFDSHFKKNFDRLYSEYLDFQKKYDLETKNSRNFEKQSEIQRINKRDATRISYLS